MSDEREATKGRLLNLWLEDIKCDRALGTYQETESLLPDEIEELIALARFMKGNLYPSSSMPVDLDNFASKLGRVVSRERRDQIELNRAAIEKSESFGKLVSRLISSSGMDKTALQRAVALARNALLDLETEVMPPHRLPVESMVRLLVALRLASTDIVDLVRQSARDWAFRIYSGGQTQLGRIDVTLTNEERRTVMEDQGDLDAELTRINIYCERLLSALAAIREGQDLRDSHPADGGTWPQR